MSMGWSGLALVDLGAVDGAWDAVFGGEAPSWLLSVLALVGLAGLLWKGAAPIATTLSSGWRSQVAPRFKLDRDSRLQATKRRSLAALIFERTQALGRAENWLDQRYAELEARVMIDGQRHRRGRLRWLGSERRSRRVERSLGRALIRSHDSRMVLLGDPGSGKSVALRHAAEHLARRGRRSLDPDQVLPVYVNLRGYAPSGPPSVASLRDYVRESLIGDAPATQATYIDSVFEPGLIEGSWVFLFDSFDEIPAILSSTEADGTVSTYRNVINSFTGEARCRVVLASRHFRGPALSGWTELMLLPLTSKRQVNLVRRAQLPSVAEEREVLTWLRDLDGPLRDMVSNPLFLQLVCEQVGEEGELPVTSFDVFDRFITKRLERDEPSVRRRHGLSAAELRDFAERAAFVFADRRLGLEPEIAEVATALGEDEEVVRARVDGLEHVRLMSTTQTRTGVKFAHRRFQEYFATSAFLRGDGSVDVECLVRDGRWRETAVTILQTRSITELGELLGRITSDLQAHAAALDANPALSWPPGLRNLLDLVESGLAGRRSEVPVALRDAVSSVLDKEAPTVVDLKWAVETSGCCHDEVRERLLTSAFSKGGSWTHVAAFSSALRHGARGTAVRSTIAAYFVAMECRGTLAGSYHWLDRRLTALVDRPLRRVLRLAHWAPRIDAAGATLLLLAILLAGVPRFVAAGLVAAFALGHVAGYSTASSVPARRYGFDSVGLGRVVNATGTVAGAFRGLRVASAYFVILMIPEAVEPNPSGIVLLVLLSGATVYWAMWWPTLGPVVRRAPDLAGWTLALAPLLFVRRFVRRFVRVFVRLFIWGLRPRAVLSALVGGLIFFGIVVGLSALITASPWLPVVGIALVALAVGGPVAVVGALAVAGLLWKRRYLADLPDAMTARRAVTDALGRSESGEGVWLLRVVRSRNRLALGPDDVALLLRVVALADESMRPEDDDGDDGDDEDDDDRAQELAGVLGVDVSVLRRSALDTDEVEELGRWIEEVQESAVVDA